MPLRMRFTLASRARRPSRFKVTRGMPPGSANADEQRVAASRRRRLRASDASTVRKASVWATIIVATALVIAVQRFMANPELPRELPELVPSADCPARYAALLDLAELARRDGTSSEVVMHGLNNGDGAMSACPRMTSSAATR